MRVYGSVGVLTIAAILFLNACGKKKKSTETSVNVTSITSLPDVDSIVTSGSTTSLVGYSLTNGTPPKVADIPANMATYLTGDVDALITNIKAARVARNWDTVKTLAGTFYEANSKCRIIESSARIISRLKEDTASACMIKNLGNETGIFEVSSGDPIEEGKWFAPAETNIVRKFNVRDDSTFQVFQIQGTSTESGVYQLVQTSCKDNVALRQVITRIDNNAQTMTIVAKSAKDDRGSSTNTSYFSVTGGIKKEGNGYVVDTSVDRLIQTAQAGTFTFKGTTNTNAESGEMSISGDILNAKFLSYNTGGGMTNLFKGATITKFSGTSSSDVSIIEGAGTSRSTVTGGLFTAVSRSQTIGFDFDVALVPDYVTTTSGTYLDAMNAVNFDTDAFLKLSAPKNPDIGTVNDAICSLAANSSITSKAGTGATFRRIFESCNERKLGSDQQRMCESLRQNENEIRQAIDLRKNTGGKSDGLN